MLRCKPSFSLSSFTFNERLVSSSSLFAVRVVSSTYLRLLIFLLAILIPAWASSNPVFLLMYSAYKLHKQVTIYNLAQFIQFSHSVMSDSLRPHELQHARPPCPSPTPRVYSNSCPLCWSCRPAISSSVILFSSCPQSLPASGSFPTSQLFAWGGQSTGVSASASVLPMNTQDWSPLGWTGWISLQSKRL